MLRLLVRSLVTEDQNTLEEIAEETVEIYKRRSIKRNKKNKGQRAYYFSTTFTVLESQGIISNILGHRKTLSPLKTVAFSVGVPLCATFQEEPYMRIRTVFSSIFQTVPLTEKFVEFCGFVHLPETLIDPAVVVFYSLFQVLSIRLSYGQKSWNVLDVAKKTAMVSLIHALSRMVTTRAHKVLFFVPEAVIAAYIAFQTAPLTQRLVRYGVRDSMQWMFEGILHLFSFLEKDLPDLPDDFQVPIALTCPCCKGLVHDPVESLGYFFCSECLEKWFSSGHFDHPVTREPISKDLVAHSLLLNFVARKYQMAVLKNLESRT